MKTQPRQHISNKYNTCTVVASPGYNWVQASRYLSIAPDKRWYLCNIFFLFVRENICCRYSLEVPHWDTSNEYSQHFNGEIRKNISTFGLKRKVPDYLEICLFQAIFSQNCSPDKSKMGKKNHFCNLLIKIKNVRAMFLKIEISN